MLEAAEGRARIRLEAVAPGEIAQCIRERRDCFRFTVVFSGDTGFFSGVKKLLPLLEDCDVKLLPGLSSLQVLCARVGVSYEDVVPVSLHGRDADIVPDVAQHRRVFALVGGADGMTKLCRTLVEANLGEVLVTVGERLGYPEERIVAGTAMEMAGQAFAPLSAALIENNGAAPFTPGLPDEWFQRGGGASGKIVPMTKREVRAVALSQLRPTEKAICWDVGAGTGSVSIEIALQVRSGKVYAVEKNDAALALLRENQERFHVRNLEVISGAAPEICQELPVPTHVFIGGSSGGLREIIALVLAKNPSARIVVTAVTLESIAEMDSIVKYFPFTDVEITAINVSRSREAGDYHLMTAQNPVYLFALQRQGESV